MKANELTLMAGETKQGKPLYGPEQVIDVDWK
jgi:hypothetical protein